MEEIQSKVHIIRFVGDVKIWPPSVELARPSACVACEVSARVGTRIMLHGHGLRERQQRGPAKTGGLPECLVILVRRYACQACSAVMTVLPATAQSRKHFSGAAVAMALALWTLCGESAEEVRRRVNDWRPGPGARGWRSLTRWAAAAVAGTLFSGLSLGAGADVARVAQALCGHVPPALRERPIHEQAFVGAAHVA